MNSSPFAEGLVMAKPVGPRCNLRCGYCYYLEKSALFPGGGGVMDQALLDRYVTQRFVSTSAKTVHFEWHGGEPTLAGLEYFRALVKVQRRRCPPGRSWTNGIQTNGVRLDAEWVSFLASEGFSVGLSLDGAPYHHNPYRPKADGSPSHGAVLSALKRLKEKSVFVNLLCVVHQGNVTDPEGVYEFLKATGVPYLQFLPLVPGASASEWGEFLCRVYDLWISADVGAVVVQNIDEALRPHAGVPHSLCIHRPTCGDVAVLEHDGSFYSCDHFVNPEHRLGNLNDTSLEDLWTDPRQKAFGQAKLLGLPPACLSCEVLESCNGGCPKDRDSSGLNRLCSAYKRFFVHSAPGLRALASHRNRGLSLRTFRWVP